MKQRAAITFEAEETIVLKQGRKAVIDFCPTCGTDVEMISPDVLALLTGVSERTIFRLIEAGRIHFIEPDRVLACSRCYRESLSEGQRSLCEGSGKRIRSKQK
jgi:hypothetical protein